MDILFSSTSMLSNGLGYIGPGAGFAFLGSAFVFVLVLVMAVGSIVFWPIRWLWRQVRGKKISKNAKTRRLVIVGLDGLDPKLVSQYMEEGNLPNLQKLKGQGGFKKLKTTFPSISPVAWSTFQTGVNPGAHNIYDFLSRDKRLYLPDLSSMSTQPPKKTVCIGKWKIPISKPEIKLLRKSQTFWKILGKSGVLCNVLRVPISCPPEGYEGNILSGMMVPDLKGTQGTFSFYTSAPDSESEKVGGHFVRVEERENKIKSEIEGPQNPLLKESTLLTIPFTVTLNKEKQEAVLKVQKNKIHLKLKKFSPWVRLEFKAAMGVKVSGICRFHLRQMEPHFELYVSPININPEKPAMPISHPGFFSTYLAKLNGLFGTLGLMEDTWARNEYILDNDAFLEQSYLTHEERRKMFLNALDKTPEGLCVCVFDASDRIQHIFWRYIDEGHPSPTENPEKYRSVIPDMYQKMDHLVGETMAKLGKKDTLIVMSDHGFSSFRRGINVNTWLQNEGYLKLKNGKPSSADHFQDVDWSQTKAFAVGLSGIYFNRVGRERQGIVTEEEVSSLKQEISEKLSKLRDPQNDQTAVNQVYDTAKIYRGAYVEEAPDLVVGYAPGYRISWDSVTGKMREEVFEDNVKAWSGDHSIDPTCVPGIFFSNRAIQGNDPDMLDIAPTVLDLFGLKVPSYMEGKPLF